ncbi:MAG TPA: SDR family NAD(P)-dependent oxidoreductase [Acidobacteriaceae bacterium]|nr:SDR family NAD(P)-dependent oxidoreductase [Acidobacteriaceae bacterium]
MKARTILIPGLAVAGAGVLCAGAAAAASVAAVGACTLGRRGRSLQGKVVVIGGGSRGLGLALAEEFGRRGASLALAARHADNLQGARIHLARRGVVASADDVLAVAADLTQAEEAEQVIRQATERFGRVDILVNNAGMITVGPAENQRLDDFREVMEANFFSAVNATLAALPQMLERRDGVIVNVASIGGKVAVPHLLPYTASKFALVGFSEGLYAELRTRGIHVLTVCPGLMRTGSHLGARFSGDAEREYQWFSLAANLPGVSTSAAHAARRIVRAVTSRRTEIAITPQAFAAARLSAVAPELTLRALAAVNRLLPPAAENGGEKPRRGAEARGREWKAAAAMGGRAARRYNQSA